MNRSQMIALYNQDQRGNAILPLMRREVAGSVVRHVDLSSVGEGIVLYSELSAANADAAIREQVHYFETIGQDFEWKLYDFDQPGDLKERLAGHGFMIEEEEAFVVLDLDDTPAPLLAPVRHDVRRIRDTNQLVDVQTIESAVWEEDASWVFGLLGGALNDDPNQLSIYVAYIEGQPASAAWTFFAKQGPFAGLFGGSTVHQYRGQGLYTALLATRIQEAKARNVQYLTVDASPMSRPILEKFGFELIGYTYPCKWRRRGTEKMASE